ETEQRIALARSYFNDAASAFNTAIEVFPDSLFAKLGGFRRMPLLEAYDFERAEVRVQLAS
ncbi:MAG: LemA family protein, partial [Verrucomicrobiota bacterium]